MSEIENSMEIIQNIEIIKAQFFDFLKNFEENQIKYYEEQAKQMKFQQKNTLYVDHWHLCYHEKNFELFYTIITDFWRIEKYLRQVVAEFVFSVNGIEQHIEIALHSDYSANSPVFSVFYFKLKKQQSDENKIFYLSFSEFPNHNTISEMDSHDIGKLNSIRGFVIRLNENNNQMIYENLVCQLHKMQEYEGVQQLEYIEPDAHNTLKNHEEWLFKNQQLIFSDFLTLRVQDVQSKIPPGGIPNSIDIIVRKDIADKVKLFDQCIFTGYLVGGLDITDLTISGEKTEMSDKKEGVSLRNQGNNDGITGLTQIGQRYHNNKFIFYANNIEKRKNRLQDWENEFEDLTVEQNNQKRNEFSVSYLEQIKRMREKQDIYERLASSIAPTVYEHLDIKKGILLMLFGGVHKKSEEGINFRGNINMCIVGNPITDKSQFLKYIYNMIPSSTYSSGRTSNAASITASFQRDPETGENQIEAGALILSNHSICCIDEFNKMDKLDLSEIHQAINQQSISIANDGIQTTLNFSTSILASASPVFKRYDLSQSLKNNLDISDSIISNFDLFFIISDEYNQFSNKIKNSHNNDENEEEENNLASNFTTGELLNYIRFSKQIKPTLTQQAQLELQKSIQKLKQNNSNNSEIQDKIVHESLIRLSEALARVYLSEYILPEYVQEATRLLSSSILKIGEHSINLIYQQEKIRITFQQYIELKNTILQTILDMENEEKTNKDKYTENGMEIELQYGFRWKDIVDQIIYELLEKDMINTEEEAISYLKLYNAVIQKLMDEFILIIVEDNKIFDQRRLYIQANYIEQY